MSTALRRTGVNVLGDMPWGSHACMFYESKEDLFDTVGPYFKTGLESNEFCLWFPSAPPTNDEARRGLSLRIPDLERHLAAGNMEILPGEAWYLDGDRFDVERLARAWDDKLRGALAKGYDGMRASGNAVSLRSKHWDHVCDHERRLNGILAGKPIMALCTHPMAVSSAAAVLEVAQAHQIAVARQGGEWVVVEPVPAAAHALTLREREVLWWAAQGKSAWEIGEILRIAERTVNEHTQKAGRKLGAVNRTQAVAMALRERLIGKDPPASKLEASANANLVLDARTPRN
jgi:DNA-binding CsgD family transcriptional regulator